MTLNPMPRRLLAALALMCAAGAGHTAGCEAATDLQGCQDLGGFIAGVVRVAASDARAGPNSQVRSLAIVVRLHNTGARPVVLAYQDGSLQVIDNNGNTFNRPLAAARRVAGIGLARGKVADPQLQLSPGQSRELRFEAALGYMTRDHKPFGDALTVDFTLAELRLPNATQMRFVRDHAVSLAGARVSAFGGGRFDDIGSGSRGGNGNGTQAATQLLQDLHKLANKKQ